MKPLHRYFSGNSTSSSNCANHPPSGGQINGFHGSLKKPSQSLVHFSASNMNKTSYLTVLQQIPLICGKAISKKKGSISSTYDAYIAVSRYSGTWRAESLCCRSSGTNKASVAVLHFHHQSNMCEHTPLPPSNPGGLHQLVTHGASIPSTSYLLFFLQPKQSSLPAVFDPVHVPNP